MSAAREWITDRLPTAADADENGDVRVRHGLETDPSTGPYFHWKLVVPGLAWCHTDIWEAPTKPALAVGQRWRRRDGGVVTISERNVQNEAVYPFCAGGHWYSADGTSCLGDSHADLVELIEPVTTPRRFVSISRTVWMGQGGIQYDYIDAVADDGTAWWMGPRETEWQQEPALPARTSND